MNVFRSSPRVATLVALLGLWVGAGGCTDMAADSPLKNARASPEALARAALEALSASDSTALADLMVSREEYLELLWPSLPDRNHVPFEFVWSLTGPRSRKARREALGELGGVPLELIRVDLGEKIEAYEEFTLYQEARMYVRRLDTGQEGPIALMDVVVQMRGGWKFLNFGEDL